MNAAPDFVAYHKSINAELEAIKDRVRTLVRHWPADGHFKEAILRSVLRRHLPENLFIGTGFIVAHDVCSTQIDILITDRSHPRLFSEGDTIIVTPDAVRAVIEVKTGYDSSTKIDDDIVKLAEAVAIGTWSGHKQFSGLFIYEERGGHQDTYLSALEKLERERSIKLDAIACGPDLFIDKPKGIGRMAFSGWLSRRTGGMAGAHFISKLIDCFSWQSRYSHPVAWNPMILCDKEARHLPQDGKNVIETIDLATCLMPSN